MIDDQPKDQNMVQTDGKENSSLKKDESTHEEGGEISIQPLPNKKDELEKPFYAEFIGKYCSESTP